MRYAVIATYVNGTSTGAVINAVSESRCLDFSSGSVRPRKVYSEHPGIRILTKDRGGEFEEEL